MLKFVRENWLWVVIPFVVVILAAVVLWWLYGREGGTSPFIYNV